MLTTVCCEALIGEGVETWIGCAIGVEGFIGPGVVLIIWTEVVGLVCKSTGAELSLTLNLKKDIRGFGLFGVVSEDGIEAKVVKELLITPQNT